MKIRLAVPLDKITHKFHIGYNKNQFPDVELFKLPSHNVRDLLYSNRVEAALIDPFTYGNGLKKGDFRIITDFVLSATSYTELMSIYFNSGIETFKTLAVPEDNEFLVYAAKILLAERYGMLPKLITESGKAEDLLKKYDAAMIYGADKKQIGMDVTEDWTDLFGIPFPMNFWVVRANEHPENIREILNKIAAEDIKNEIDISNNDENDLRSGFFSYQWHEQVELGLENTLDLLYYHKYIDEIPDIKIFREKEEEGNIE